MKPQAEMFGFEPTYQLKRLELFNWGGFAGAQAVEIDPQGTAIIGPTGSGKTTLVDALMTLLTANPKYNLASTGGHESDRDLVSYVRGVSGVGNGSTEQSHVARQGKTFTGICATFASSDSQVKLAGLFWIDSNSLATSDLNKLWLFSNHPEQSLSDWLTALNEGGKRAVTQLEKSTTGLWSYPSKKRYLARTRDFFEVRENAFNLLNRAAGLKQLNSIDEIFRELVLDDASQFDRALEVANSFDDLTAIYQELEVARRQLRSLEPVKQHWEKYQQRAKQLHQQKQLSQGLPAWFAEQAYTKWKTEQERLLAAVQSISNELEYAEEQHQHLNQQRDDLYARYLNLGGKDLQAREQLIDVLRNKCDEKQRYANEYLGKIRILKLDDTLSREALENNQQQIFQQQHTLEQQKAEAEETSFQAGATTQNSKNRLLELQQELSETQRSPGSNIHSKFRSFRSDLAGYLELDDNDLPFVAELVQVKSDQQDWRGAIERAIGSQRLRILVPEQQMKDALSWINQRNNRLHVRLYEVRQQTQPARFMDDGFTRKLDYKAHPYRESLKSLLAGIDLHCVDSADDLRHTEHAITREGTLSGKARFFEKQDQKSLTDDWMTGFDNRDRLEILHREVQICQAEVKTDQAAEEKSRSVVSQLTQQLVFAQALLDVQFEQINQPKAQAELDSAEMALQRMTAPDSDLSAAQTEYEQVKQACADSDKHKIELNKRITTLLNQQKNAEQQGSKARQIAEPGLTKSQRELADIQFKTLQSSIQAATPDGLADLQYSSQRKLNQTIDTLLAQVNGMQTDLVRAMEKAKTEDRGALLETGTELEDVPEYLERRQRLQEEALPEKQKRFRDYLNRSSDDGVTSLLTMIDSEVAKILDRLEDVNNTLRRVDFQPGHYLQLVAHKVVHERLGRFNKSIGLLRSARLAGDDGDSHYKALRMVVEDLRALHEKRHTQAAKALLDPRFRLQFKVSVIDRATGDTLETRSGSQGGSGGEKEIIASYVLTASLSYALCPDGSSQPLFGTIVLDEAFSRSSHAVAGRIIEALREFGLHALFITPNKEMRLLRNHTRSAIVVHRRGNASSLTALSWQALEEKGRQRYEHKL
ncbi:MAG: AAA family ATPase [Oceanobacter sp.]